MMFKNKEREYIMNNENTIENFSPINVSEHIKPHYDKFKDWYLTSYMSLGNVVIPLEDRFIERPRKINMQYILFDAYMSREQEIQQLKQQISQLEKASNNQNPQKNQNQNQKKG